MQLAYAFLANAATVTDGTLSVLGADFDTIRARTFPTHLPLMAVVVKLDLDSPDELAGASFRLRMADDKGESVVPEVKGVLEPDQPQQSRRHRPGAFSIFYLMGLQLPTPGDYHVLLEIKGKSIADIPLFIEHDAS